MKNTIVLLLFLLKAGSTLCNATTINSVLANASTIDKYGKFELTIDLVSSWKNPYDYDEMDLRCIFVSPVGKQDTVDAFFMQPYTVDAASSSAKAVGQSKFKVRFAPNTPGIWRYFLTYNDGKKITSSPTKVFTCTQNKNSGFIKKNKSNYLSFNDGSPFIPIGENVNCPDKNVFTDYTKWMSKLSANDANVMNVWMIFSGFGIEWTGKKDSNFMGLEKYNQVNAFHLDWLLDECVKRNLYILLGLNTIGNATSTVNPPWSENPYSKGAGGPCLNEGDFFQNSDAIHLHKNRLRYIIARYGYSKSIMAWNLFIEVDAVHDYKRYKTAITNWHTEMGSFIKTLDVNKHLVSTSYSYDKENEATWKLQAIDITQTHYYVKSANPEKNIVHGNKSYLKKYNKPTLTTEFGIDPENIDLVKLDPTGIYLHNVLWATSFSGGMGPALTYWWTNYIEPQNLYFHFKPLAAFLKKLSFINEKYAPVRATITTRSTQITIKPSAGWGAVTDTAFQIDQGGTVSPTDDRLGVYLYGRLLNTQSRTPVVFNVNYLKEGFFTILVGEATASPELSVTIDSKKAQVKKVKANGNYTFNAPAGSHVIKVENTGKDWLWVKEYQFSNAGAVLNSYVLKNELSTKAAGYIVNEGYNWQAKYNRVQVANETGKLAIASLKKGTYTVTFYDPSTLKKLAQSKVVLQQGNLVIDLPVVKWDVAFIIEKQ